MDNVVTTPRPSASPVNQAAIESVARAILSKTSGEVSINRLPLLPRSMMKIAMSNPELRTQLFRLVDVFPTLGSSTQTVSHLVEYLGDPHRSPLLLARALRLVRHIPSGTAVASWLTRRNLSSVATMFIAGENPAQIVTKVSEYASRGLSTTTDVLGEKTLAVEEADAYEAKVADLIGALVANPVTGIADALRADHLGPLPFSSVSVKPTALSSKYSSLHAQQGINEVFARCMRLFTPVRDGELICYMDMEDHDVKDLTIDLIEALALEPSLLGANLGIVIQAYLRGADQDVERIAAISRARIEKGGTPLFLRLVKGAYFDAELVKSDQETWDPVIFTEKAATDANYEHCIDTVFSHIDVLRPAFGSHNLRSISYAIARADSLGVARNAYEIQMLYGMADALAVGVKSVLPRVRLYLPMGDLIPGMSYLVRRLLENTSNESFLRQGFVESKARDVAQLVAPPRPTGAGQPAQTAITEDGYQHAPSQRFDAKEARRAFAAAIQAVDEGRATSLLAPVETSGRTVPTVIAGRRIFREGGIASLNPAAPTRVVAVASESTTGDVAEAIAVARAAQRAWAETPVAERSEVLARAAQYLRERQREVAALEVVEAAKNWKEADADVTEAIDFLEFYRRAMVRLVADTSLLSPLGERNTRVVVPRGVVGVIAPWNFPLAIPLGMVSAALVAGNAVVLKPAEQTPLVAYCIIQAFEAAGLPSGVLNFVPGRGEVVGRAITESPEVDTIAFTGSYAVGTEILAASAVVRPGQRALKTVVCELGGKNPLIVDADADLDQVVPGAMYSAFGFAGQKCSAASRLIVHERHFDRVVERMEGALAALVVGDPRRPDADVGPVIDEESYQRLTSFIADPSRTGRVVRHGSIPDAPGYYVPPTLVIAPDAEDRVLHDELFGPVLAIQRATDLDHAIALANATDYALTAGIYSRSPSAIERAAGALVAGNVYINRGITGAVPGRQPFGGFGRSGLGSKAGGADYLLHFVNTKVVTENTLRQGFVPEIS
jgi:RHH-type proline utilization regulon transcriptional repressor/proline dehydrogenase/delta 1-pyrroline-5-carboxylate dehydrogenase